MKKLFYLVCIAFVAFFCFFPTGLNSQLNGGSLGGGISWCGPLMGNDSGTKFCCANEDNSDCYSADCP